MTTNSIYMDEILSELLELDDEAITEIHDSELNGVNLPKLSVSEDVITSLRINGTKMLYILIVVCIKITLNRQLEDMRRTGKVGKRNSD